MGACSTHNERYRVQGLESGISSLGFRVKGLGFRFWGQILGFGVRGLGFRV
jgi:hypothetical protein